MTKKELVKQLDLNLKKALDKLSEALDEAGKSSIGSAPCFEELTNVVATLIDVRVGLHEVPSKAFPAEGAEV